MYSSTVIHWYLHPLKHFDLNKLVTATKYCQNEVLKPEVCVNHIQHTVYKLKHT